MRVASGSKRASTVAEVSTPCIKICTIDPVSRLCAGCLRTLDEIGAWGGLSEAERRRIIVELPARSGRIGRR